MKRKTGEEALRNILERAQQYDYDHGIVAYAFYDIKKKAFIAPESIHGINWYTGDLAIAHIVHTRIEAFFTLATLQDNDNAEIIPLIDTVFGLSPKPGWMENEIDQID